MVKPSAEKHAALVEFYTKALAPIGYSKLKSFPDGLTGFGQTSPDWWVAIDTKNTPSAFHVAFKAPGKAYSAIMSSKIPSNLTWENIDSAAVDAFYKASLEAGAKGNGPPGLRAAMDPKYYAAFILDPLGNNLEVGCMVN